jgi:hypothetical protein
MGKKRPKLPYGRNVALEVAARVSRLVGFVGVATGEGVVRGEKI